jgi:hypothetical protein
MNSIPLWLKRRIGEDNLKTFVDQSIQQQPTPCSDFSDEFEYADNIISWACDDFLTVDESLPLGEDYDEIYSLVYDYIKELFGFELLELYRDTCGEED